MPTRRSSDRPGEVLVEIGMLSARNVALPLFLASFRRLHQVKTAIHYPPLRLVQLLSQLVNADQVIVTGHCRWMSCQKEPNRGEMSYLPCTAVCPRRQYAMRGPATVGDNFNSIRNQENVSWKESLWV